MTYRGPVTEGVEILEPNAEVEQEGLDPRLNAARRPKMRRHKYICICADAVAAPDDIYRSGSGEQNVYMRDSLQVGRTFRRLYPSGEVEYWRMEDGEDGFSSRRSDFC